MGGRARFLAAAVVGIGTALAGGASTADEIDRGRALYRERCLECHGNQGRGDGPKSERLGFQPRNFTLGAFKCRSTPTGQPPTDTDLERVVTQGLPGTPMMGVGDRLEDGEVRALVAYLKTLSPVFERTTPVPIDRPAPPDNLAELAAEGKHVYQVLQCWTCHGISGRGNGPAAKGLVDEWGNRIRVFNFVALRRFKCGGEPADLYRTLHTGMTGSPMPSFTEAFPFGREEAEVAAGREAGYDPEEVARLLAWAGEQPERAAIESVPEAERTALVEHRTWALVAYLRSLAER